MVGVSLARMETRLKVIMRLALAFAALAAVFLFDVPASQAWTGNGPWCAVADTGGGRVEEDCHYSSIETCSRYVIAGNRGFCNPNPRWEGASAPVRKSKSQRNRHDQ